MRLRPEKGLWKEKQETTEKVSRVRDRITSCAVVRVRKHLNKFTISGGNDEGVTPVPIPNTEVKPFSAESTWLETAREDRSLPDSNIPQ